MPTKISQEVTEKILDDLTGSRDVDDIVMEVCEKTGLGWQEVEAYVNRLAVEDKSTITLGQSPLLILLALGTFIGGLIAILSSGYQVYQVYQVYIAAPQVFMVYAASNGARFLRDFLLGSAMIAGSLKGMQDVWEAIFEKLGIGSRQ